MGIFATKPQPTKYYGEHVASMPQLDGQTFAITGCTTGLGLHAARAIATRGGTVLMLNRPSPRADAALAAVRAAAADDRSVAHIDCDLSDLAMVKAAAEQVARTVGSSGLDVLCNNAGEQHSHLVATCPACASISELACITWFQWCACVV